MAVAGAAAGGKGAADMGRVAGRETDVASGGVAEGTSGPADATAVCGAVAGDRAAVTEGVAKSPEDLLDTVSNCAGSAVDAGAVIAAIGASGTVSGDSTTGIAACDVTGA